MKKINFKSVTAKNFLSIGDVEVKVEFNKGFHLITGENLDKPDRRNGVGKSTIAEIVYFAIFGETLRGISKKLIPNNVTNKKCEVSMEFDIEFVDKTKVYKIVRTLSPSKLYLFEDGEDITRDSMSNTTESISRLISASPTTFKSCVIMTISDTIPFMAKGNVDKRKFIEDIFGLEVFSDMTKRVRLDYNETKREVENVELRLGEVVRSYNSYLDQRDNVNLEKSKRIKVLEDRRSLHIEKHSDILAEAKLIKSGIESSTDLLSEIGEYDATIKSLCSDMDGIESDITTRVASIHHIKSELKLIGVDGVKCPSCLRKMDDHDFALIEEHKLKLVMDAKGIGESVMRLREKFNDIKGSVDSLRSKKSETLERYDKNEDLKRSVKLKVSELTTIKEYIKDIDTDIKNIGDENVVFDDIISDREGEIGVMNKNLKTLRDKLSMLNQIKFIVSEDGVKSYIVGKLLDIMNSRMDYYLKKLDANSTCKFDEYFEETITNERGKVCSYFNFSGAERKSLDLACLFTFSDLRRMQGDVQYNISMYDELFDSSFDSKGIDIVSSLLQERVDELDECVYLISHRNEISNSISGDVIYLIKEGGVTKRITEFDN